MTSFAHEVLAKMPTEIRIEPMTVVTTNPLVVTIGASPVVARAVTGQAFTVGQTGFALYQPPLPPLCFTTSTDATDTGWVDLTYESGFTSANGGQAAYRMIGNQVFLKGGADRTSGDYTTTASTVCVIPVAARPGQTERFASYGTLGRIGRVEVTTAGAINIAVPNNVDPDSPFGWMGISHTYLTD